MGGRAYTKIYDEGGEKMRRKNKPAFPELEKQILTKGLLKRNIAVGMGINDQTLSRKLTGQVEFTLKEIRYLASVFPEVSIESLFNISR